MLEVAAALTEETVARLAGGFQNLSMSVPRAPSMLHFCGIISTYKNLHTGIGT